jgi:uncharacterized protein (TIGR02996 family)
VTTTADETAFRRGICESPADDVGRLAYAGWLQERGELERAEFIRVQVELARMDEAGEGVIDPREGHTCCEDPCPVCVSVGRYKALEQRERDLFDEHWARWGHQAFDLLAPDVGTSTDGNENRIHVTLYGRKPRQDELADFYCDFRRGSVSSLTLPWAVWAGGVCPNCRGRGSNALPSNFADWSQCHLCSGTGRTPGVAESLYWRLQPCDDCDGTGKDAGLPDDDWTCRRCSGSGRVVPTVECPWCDSTGLDSVAMISDREELASKYDVEQYKRTWRQAYGYDHPACLQCSGTGRVPRPFPGTAQPLERVAFTTWPDVGEAELRRHWPGVEFVMPAGEPAPAG